MGPLLAGHQQRGGRVRGSIVECADICAITGDERPGDAARCLREEGARMFEARNGRPSTTIALIEAAGGLLPSGHYVDKYGPADV